MNQTVLVNLIPVSGLRRPQIKMDWETITVHNTGNTDSTAQNERDWLTNPSNTRQASWHYVIHEDQVIQAIPETEVAWHAGDGRGDGNMKSLSIEICESGNFEESVQTAIIFIAEKLHSKGKGIEAVKRHKDWNGKNCPRLLIPVWGQFLNRIEKELIRLNTPDPVPSHWAEKYWLSLKSKGIKIHEQRFDDRITRGEVFALLDQIIK